MADSVPNWKLEQQRIRASIAGLTANIEQQRLNILEMADRAAKHRENIDASERAIADYRGKLASLESTHGALTADEAAAMEAALVRDED